MTMIPDVAEVQSFVGTYTIDGAEGRGRLALVRRGAFLHAEANLDSGQIRYGLAMPFADRLVMAIGPKDKVEIGAYAVAGDKMEGLWIPPGSTDDDFAKC